MRVYLDNAATTPLDSAVLDAMLPYLRNNYGNPSSIHSHGREARSAIEKARKTIAGLLNASPGEIFFTAGGTEADNMAISCSIASHNITHAVTTQLEHHAVLHCLQHNQQQRNLDVTYLHTNKQGLIDLAELEEVLAKRPGSFVSLMHANNEVATMNPIARIAEICKATNSPFHSDTVQTMGHYPIDCTALSLDFLTGSGHKFHGPKGTGFVYINSRMKIHPFIHGGAQERNMRGGTENVAGIAGLAKALEIAVTEQEAHRRHITALKARMIERLKASIEEISFNGDSGNVENSLYTVLNLSLPASEVGDMLLFSLDIAGISASGGSACSSGSEIGSHVLRGINADPARGAVRFSFSKYNTPDEIDYACEKVAELYPAGVRLEQV
ncbi:MAG: cysteine desulfurase family protein [Bacteroidota bacterium]